MTNEDPDSSGAVLSGEDSIVFEKALAADALRRAKTVTVALHGQPTPP